jgi:hypothetical protein
VLSLHPQTSARKTSRIRRLSSRDSHNVSRIRSALHSDLDHDFLIFSEHISLSRFDVRNVVFYRIGQCYFTPDTDLDVLGATPHLTQIGSFPSFCDMNTLPMFHQILIMVIN